MSLKEVTERNLALICLIIVALVFGFYVLSTTSILNLFPTENLSYNLGELNEAGSSYTSLLILAGISYFTIAIGIGFTVLGIVRIIQLPKPFRHFGLAGILILSVGSTIVLFVSANRTIDIATTHICFENESNIKKSENNSFCKTYTKMSVPAKGQKKLDLTNRSNMLGNHVKLYADVSDVFRSRTGFYHGLNKIKYMLNAVFQMAAIALLTALLLWASAGKTDLQSRQKRVRELFYSSSVLLSLMIFTDVLFFDFLSSLITDSTSALLQYQRGLLFFFAIVSSATMGLILVAAAVIGNGGLDLSLSEQEGSAGGTENSSNLFHQFFQALMKFLGSNGTGTALATFAPVFTAIIGSAIELS